MKKVLLIFAACIMLTGSAMAADNEQNTILFFHASWCGACKQMDCRVLSRDDVRTAISDGYVLKHVDTGQDCQQSRKYAIRLLPTILIISPEGEVLARHEGYLSAQSFKCLLSEHRQKE